MHRVCPTLEALPFFFFFFAVASVVAVTVGSFDFVRVSVLLLGNAMHIEHQSTRLHAYLSDRWREKEREFSCVNMNTKLQYLNWKLTKSWVNTWNNLNRTGDHRNWKKKKNSLKLIRFYDILITSTRDTSCRFAGWVQWQDKTKWSRMEAIWKLHECQHRRFSCLQKQFG